MTNNFLNDPYCEAWWRFEGPTEPDNRVDALGKCPDLAPFNFPIPDAVNFMEGSGSVQMGDLLTARAYYINDVDLPASFPLKNGGGKVLSWVGWYRTNGDDDAYGNWPYMVSKPDSLRFELGTLSGDGAVAWYHGAGNEVFGLGWRPSGANHWYHFGVVADGVNKTLAVRIYGQTEAAVVVNASFTPVNVLALSAQPFNLGGGWPYVCGNFDEVVVFSRLLSMAEIENIRAGRFSKARIFTVINVHRGYETQPGRRCCPV